MFRVDIPAPWKNRLTLIVLTNESHPVSKLLLGQAPPLEIPLGSFIDCSATTTPCFGGLVPLGNDFATCPIAELVPLLHKRYLYNIRTTLTRFDELYGYFGTFTDAERASLKDCLRGLFFTQPDEMNDFDESFLPAGGLGNTLDEFMDPKWQKELGAALKGLKKEAKSTRRN
jgi:hypothetical protein